MSYIRCKKIGLIFLLMQFSSYLLADNNINQDVLNLAQNTKTPIVIPQQAVVVRSGIPGVFVVDKNEARFRMVRLGKQFKKSTAILAGLFGNEVIIISNTSGLYDGMALQKND